MNILARSRILIIAIAIAASIGLVGCGGGGGGSVAAVASVPAGPSAPTANLTATPTVTIDTSNATTLKATADTFALAITAAVNSLIKTGAMYGILSMTTPWPTTTGTSLPCSSGGSVTWNGSNFTGGTGNAVYSGCNAAAGVGPVDGSIALTYAAYPNPNVVDFVADMSTPGINLLVSNQYAPGYMISSGTQANFLFTGKYTFNPTSHSPVYFVDTGTSFGSQTVIGQPMVTGTNGGTMLIDNPPPSANFAPGKILVRSNIDAAGNWVEIQFNKWDVDTALGRPIPAISCATSPCSLVITDAKGNKAAINVTTPTPSLGQTMANQTMVFTPAASGAASTPVQVAF